jgi:hypothetical protein
VSSGHVRPHAGIAFRERNPWLAFEDGFRMVRGFIQRLDAGTTGPIQARLGEDLRSLGEGSATTVIALSGPGGLIALRDDPNAYGRTAETPRVRLVIGQPPMRPSLDRLGVAYHATSWILGREAASLLPLDALAGGSLRIPFQPLVHLPLAVHLLGYPGFASIEHANCLCDGIFQHRVASNCALLVTFFECVFDDVPNFLHYYCYLFVVQPELSRRLASRDFNSSHTAAVKGSPFVSTT